MPEVLEVTLAEKRKKLKLLQKKQQLQRDNGLVFYKPHVKQEKFHRAWRYKGRYARTGNRFGKSHMGTAEDLSWCLGERLWVPKDDPFRYEGLPNFATKGLLVCTDWDKATEIFTSMEEGSRGKLFEMLPRSRIAKSPHRNHGGHVDKVYITHRNGDISTLYIDTVAAFKQNSMGAESSDWDFVHVDEPIPQDFWKAISRGLMDRGGKYWFTCTPLCEMWINDHFIPQSRLRDTFDEPLTVGDRRWVLTGSVFDNPTLNKKDIDEFLDTLTEDERACRAMGIPMAMSGLIFRQFEHDRHKMDFNKLKGWKDHHTPPDDYTIRVAIDPHPKVPHAVLFCATAPSGQTFFFAEIFKHPLIKDLVSSINTVLGGRRAHKYICDPMAWVENPITGRTMADEFYACGLPVEKASKELEYGIMKAQQALSHKDELYFEESLQRTIWEFDHYSWDEKKERPIDKDDHMMENFRRLVLCGLTYIAPGEYNIADFHPIDYRRAPLKTPPTRELAELGRDARPSNPYRDRNKRYPA